MHKTPPRDALIDEFITAAWQNDVAVIDDLATKHPWLVDPAGPHLLSALHTACSSCQKDSARVLVEKYHADVNAVADPARGMTALHEAMNSADNETARMLIRNGANVNARDRSREGFTDGWTPLHYAVSSGNAEMQRFLLSHGADPSIRNDAGKTAFEMAKPPVAKRHARGHGGPKI